MAAAVQGKLSQLRLMHPARAVERLTQLQDAVAELEMLDTLRKKANRRLTEILRARRLAVGLNEKEFARRLGSPLEVLQQLEAGAQPWSPQTARMYAMVCEQNCNPQTVYAKEATLI